MSRSIFIHLILSGIGVFIGLLAFIVLFIIDGNHDVGFWSVFTGCLSAICFHLVWLDQRESLERWHTKKTLGSLHFLGFVGAVTGITAMIWYLFLAFYYHIPIQPVSNSAVIAAVWAMICGKWGIMLMYHTQKYELTIEAGTAPIVTEEGA